MDQIRKRFQESDLSAYMLAKRAGVRVSIVQAVRDGGDARGATIDKLARGLNCTIEVRPIKARKAAK